MNQKGMNFEDAYSFVKSNNFCTELNENLKKQLTSYEEIRGGSQGVGEYCLFIFFFVLFEIQEK